jgi:hypothetical protein
MGTLRAAEATRRLLFSQRLRAGKESQGQMCGRHPSLLTGMVFDETGERLTPTHAVKKGAPRGRRGLGASTAQESCAGPVTPRSTPTRLILSA